MSAPSVVDGLEYGSGLLQAPKIEAVAPGKALTWFQDRRAIDIITPFLPKGVSYEEVCAEASHAISINPELRECTPSSLLRAIGRCAQTGLIIGETVHLAIFNVKVKVKGEPDRWEKRCQRIIGYNGEIELIIRAGSARSVYAEPVYQAEIEEGRFKYEQGTEPRILHRPIMSPSDRGPLAAGYAVAKINQHDVRVVVQSLEEIEEVRKLSKMCSPEKVPECPPWWAKKRCVHLLAKQLPMNPRMRILRAAIDEYEEIEAMPDGEPVTVVEKVAA